MTAATELRNELERAGFDFDVIEHGRTLTARDEASAVGVPPEHVAKTVVVTTDEGYIRAVVPASEQLDVHKVQQLLGDKHARLASEAELVSAYPMYELGAVPPFGAPAGDRVLFDRRLAERDSVLLEAGTHSESVRLKTVDLLALAKAEVVDIAKGAPPAQP